MNAAERVVLVRRSGAQLVVPVHYEGWGHFHQGRHTVGTALRDSPDIAAKTRWLRPGQPSRVSAGTGTQRDARP